MWSMPAPSLTVGQAVDFCTSGGSGKLAQALRQNKSVIEQRAALFHQHAEDATCWKLTSQDLEVPCMAIDQMKSAYKTLMVKGPGRRPVYDAIMSGAQLRRCPLCEFGEVTTLDHFLPQSQFCATILDPFNLVPVCKDCNFALLNFVASSATDEGIHPYYWKNEQSWLIGEVRHEEQPYIYFQPDFTSDFDAEKRSRISAYFGRLKLGDRLAVQSATAIQQISASIRSMRPLRDPNVISDHLTDYALQLEPTFGPNYWHAVVLRTLAADEWYCSVFESDPLP